MTFKKVFHSKIFWGLCARILNIAGGFVIVPLLVHFLDNETLSLYYLFASLTMLTGIIDFGFNATLTRNFAYAYAGAENICANGVSPNFKSSTNWALVSEIFLLAKKIYFFISIISLFIFFVPCSLYLYTVVGKSNLSMYNSISCWLIFSFAAVLALYFTYLSTLIQGRGDVNLANKITIIAKTVNVLVSAVTLFAGYGLLGVCLSSLSMCIVERILYYKFSFQDAQHCQLKKIKPLLSSKYLENFKIISVNASKFGAVAVGGYLVTRATIILSVTYLGLLDSASYIFSIQLITIIMGVSSTLIGVYMPKLNSLAHQKDEKLKLFYFSNFTSLMCFLILGVLLIAFGNYALLVIHAKTKLLNNFELISLLIIYLLEVQHSNYAALITTDNDVPFVSAALYSGVATVVVAILLLKFTTLSIWGLIIAQGVVQLFYNNWYWIYFVCKKYKTSYFDSFKFLQFVPYE